MGGFLVTDEISRVREMLHQGYGVEDIAIRLEIPVGRVRKMVRDWQKSGAILAILRNETAK